MFSGKKRIAELEAQLKEAGEIIDQLNARNFCIAIENQGRITTFTFIRDGEIHTFETMSLLSADVAQWRKDLGIDQ